MSASPDDQGKPKTSYFTSEIASKYANSVFHSPTHSQWISTLIYDALELQPGQTLVDMGCGPGRESKILMEKMNGEIHIIGVDPSAAMLDIFQKELGDNSNTEVVCMDAVTFSQSTRYSPYDRIFSKSTLHLLTAEERVTAFKGFYTQLASKKGKLLVVRAPYAEHIFPFDQRTQDLLRQAKNMETLNDELRVAGFTRIEQQTHTFEYPSNSVTVDDWIFILENRIWTMFSKEHINEQQLKDSIDHVKQRYQSPNTFQAKDIQTIIKCSTD